jgi:predicted nucleic acid-binding protein
MSLFVVDASVGIKWFVPEVLSPEALAFRNSGHELHVPAFFDVEITNIVWKKLQRGELTRQDAGDIVQLLPTLPVTRHSESPILAPAFDLAYQTQRTVYDCLYIALAQRLGGVMMTADQRLANSLAATPWSSLVQYLGTVP